MTYKNIMLTDRGLLALNAPEKHDKCNYRSYGDYCNPQTCNCSNDWKALEQAVEEGVYFKDQEETIEILESYLIYERGKSSHPIPILLKDCFNKPYPCPDGYEVKIEKSISHDEYEYAILVPKQVDIDQDVKKALENGGYFDLIEDKTNQFHCGDELDYNERCEKQCDRCKGNKI